MEAGADLQQAADATLDLDLAAGGGGDARQDLEQGALAGAVAADDAEDFALAPGAAADEAGAVVIARGFRFGGRRTWGGINKRFHNAGELADCALQAITTGEDGREYAIKLPALR